MPVATVSYDDGSPKPECSTTTTTSAPLDRDSETAARTDGTMSRTSTRPRSLSRSQTIEPGVVPDDRDTNLRAHEHDRGSVGVLPVGAVDVGGNERERRLLDDTVEIPQPVIELVVADRGCVVSDGVHRRNDRIRAQ